MFEYHGSSLGLWRFAKNIIQFKDLDSKLNVYYFDFQIWIHEKCDTVIVYLCAFNYSSHILGQSIGS